jgi:hypothetical protein
MIGGQFTDQAAEILRCDRTYTDASDSLARFNAEKDRVTSHADTKVVDYDLEARQMEAKVNAPLADGLRLRMDEPAGVCGPLSSQAL